MEALKKRQASRANTRKSIVKDIRSVQLKQMEAQVRAVRDEIALKESIKTENDKLKDLKEILLEKKDETKQKKAELEKLQKQTGGKSESVSVHSQFQNRVLATKMKLQIRAAEDQSSKLERELRKKNKFVSNLCSSLAALRNQPAIKKITFNTAKIFEDPPRRTPAVFYPKLPSPDGEAIEIQRQVSADQREGEHLAAHANLGQVQSMERVSIQDRATRNVGRSASGQGKTKECSREAGKRCENLNQSAGSNYEHCSQRSVRDAQCKQVHTRQHGVDSKIGSEQEAFVQSESIPANFHHATQTWHDNPLQLFGKDQFSEHNNVQGIPPPSPPPGQSNQPAARYATSPVHGLYQQDNSSSSWQVQTGHCRSYSNATEAIPGFNFGSMNTVAERLHWSNAGSGHVSNRMEDLQCCQQDHLGISYGHSGIAGYGNMDPARLGSNISAAAGLLQDHLFVSNHRVPKSDMQVVDLD